MPDALRARLAGVVVIDRAAHVAVERAVFAYISADLTVFWFHVGVIIEALLSWQGSPTL